MEKTPGIQELLNLVHTGNFDEFKKLMVAQNFDVNATDEAGDTILHHAAGKGKRDIVRYVIEKGANVNAKNNTGSTPLHKAIIFISDSVLMITDDAHGLGCCGQSDLVRSVSAGAQS
jgi:ankyrin repeat protein